MNILLNNSYESNKKIYIYKSIIGDIKFIQDSNKLYDNTYITGISMLKISPNLTDEFSFKETPLIKSAYNEICEYFNGVRKKFSFPIYFSGTPFQHKVWNALISVPFGKTYSYKDIANLIGNPNHCRAVGNAISKNPILIAIPCHRIIRSNGVIGGFAYDINIKKKLIDLENKDCKF